MTESEIATEKIIKTYKDLLVRIGPFSLCSVRDHLETLYSLASDCDTAGECGVGEIVSSWALVAGVLNHQSNNPKSVWGWDINARAVDEIRQTCKQQGTIDYHFEYGYVCKCVHLYLIL